MAEIIEVFIHWLYFDIINLGEHLGPRTETERDQDWRCQSEDLTEAYLLGDKLRAPGFKNVVIDRFIAVFEAYDNLPRKLDMARLFANTFSGDLMRKVVVDMYVWEGGKKFLDDSYKDIHPDFLYEFAGALLATRDCKITFKKAPYKTDMHTYHEIPDGQSSCCVKVADRKAA